MTTDRQRHAFGGGGLVTAAAPSTEALRRRAEILAWQEQTLPGRQDDIASADPAAQTLYELRVHQIELEMQNEELRQFQIDLNASQERYFDFYDMAPVGYCSVNDTGTILESNLTTANLLGVPRDSLIKQPFSRFIAPTDQDIYYLMRNKLIQTKVVQSCELRLLRFSGDSTWVALMISSTPTADHGSVMRIVLKQIDERKRISDALNASEARLRLMFDRAIDGIVILSGDGKLLAVNASFARMHGYTPTEMVSLNLRDLDTPEAVQKLPGLLERVLAGETLSFEVTHYHKNGHIITLEVSSSLIVANGERLIQAFHRDITSRKQIEETVQRQAFYDLLTGLANRMLLKDRLARSMLAGERSGNYGALMFLDLDNFKPLNDQYGHGAGDLLLAEVAKRLKNCVRQVDTVARFGGDEFVVLLDDLTSDKEQACMQADLVAGKIRKLLADPYILQIASGDLGTLQTVAHKCTVSIGVALFLGQTNTEEDVLKWADLAMYKAKDTGRDRVFFFDHLMRIENTNRAAFEEHLREAILRKQFCVYYQAQISGKHEITGVEALLRWQHPTRGWVSPTEFIPTAEKTGLILPLGLWVLETACIQLALWANRPETAHLTMAINISAYQFHQADFVDQVLAVLARSGANPGLLKLELTESLLLNDVQNMIDTMHALKARGVQFALDDFGTGYSSLSYLKRLPLDQLKIDQSFVRDILSDPDDAAIARMVIALAHSMGLGVIAEGVETEAQRELLAGMGCHNYQGFLFSPALPTDEFEALAARMRN